jgi:hypothetical protein
LETVVRLETADGHFIADAEPLLPLEPTEILVWGERFFVQHCHGKTYTKYCQIWREVSPTVLRVEHG